MYATFYGFRSAPFHVTPDASFVYLTKGHREAIGVLEYGLRERKGFVAITGEVGTGKTTVLRHTLRKFDPAKTAIVYVLQPTLTPRQLLALVWQELGEEAGEPPPPVDDLGELIRRLLFRLRALYRSGKTIIIVIDEAQTMPVETLESLRLLSNLETDKQKYVQIVLAGQPELDQMLARPELRQLNQRIAARARIPNLNHAESLAYVRFRMQLASGRTVDPFTRGALDYIIRSAAGNPRRLNIFCDNALINGLGHNAALVTRAIAEEAIAPHVISERLRRFSVSLPIGVPTMSGALALVALVAVGFVLGTMLRQSPRESVRTASGDRPTATIAPAAGAAPRDDISPAASVGPVRSVGAVAFEPKPSSRPAPTASRAATAPDKFIAIWPVQRGDTLARVCAFAYGICTPQMELALARSNPALDPRNLAEGQRVGLPVIENLRPVVP